MKEPKRYYCGNGEGMFEDNKNGHWVEYSEHKSIIEALTQQLRKHDVSGQLPNNLILYRQAKKLDYAEFCKWINAKLGNLR